MTAGAPHIADSHSRTNAAANNAQAISIRQMLDCGVPPPEVAARHRCGVARVQQIASGNAPTPIAPAATAARAPAARRRPARQLPVQPGEKPHETRERLVRHIAADPVLMAWLGEHNARILENAAGAVLVEHGEPAAATLLRAAAAHRRGEAPAWGTS